MQSFALGNSTDMLYQSDLSICFIKVIYQKYPPCSSLTQRTKTPYLMIPILISDFVADVTGRLFC